jgi:hypothetical protein
MPNLHIVIGDSNTRKSSLLRCLTGVGSGNSLKHIDVALTDGRIIKILCLLSALQESYKPRTPAEFVAYVKKLRPIPTDIAIALRVEEQGRFPEFSSYLRAFTTAGWNIENVALLGTNACSRRLDIASNKLATAPSSTIQPTNKTARAVRRVWQWA